MRDDRPAGDSTPPAVWFAYTPDRKSIHPQTHLAKFEGVLQADAYAGFNALFDDGTIREAACWAHARRKFHDLHAARATPLTTEALRRIAERYLIESEIRGKLPDERRQVRQTLSRPLLDDLERWLRSMLDTLSRKQSCTRSSCGPRCCAIATTAPSRSITLRPNAPCVAWPSAAAITCSPAPTAAASAPPRSTR